MAVEVTLVLRFEDDLEAEDLDRLQTWLEFDWNCIVVASGVEEC